MVRLRVSWRFSLSSASTVGNPSGRFKEGVFGGDKVEVLIQDLLIKADLEGGHERFSRAQSGPDPVGSIGRHPGPARGQRTPLPLALCPDAVAGRRQRSVLDLPLGTPAAARGALPARPQAGALPRHVPLLLQGPSTQTSREVAYAVTSLTREQAGPEALLSLVRGHWAIENQLHWRQDVSLREDA